jgi:hypothetical protein
MAGKKVKTTTMTIGTKAMTGKRGITADPMGIEIITMGTEITTIDMTFTTTSRLFPPRVKASHRIGSN